MIGEHGRALGGRSSRSAVRLPLDEEIPVALVRKLVKARMKKNEKEERGNNRFLTRPV